MQISRVILEQRSYRDNPSRATSFFFSFPPTRKTSPSKLTLPTTLTFKVIPSLGKVKREKVPLRDLLRGS